MYVGTVTSGVLRNAIKLFNASAEEDGEGGVRRTGGGRYEGSGGGDGLLIEGGVLMGEGGSTGEEGGSTGERTLVSGEGITVGCTSEVTGGDGYSIGGGKDGGGVGDLTIAMGGDAILGSSSEGLLGVVLDIVLLVENIGEVVEGCP